MVQPLQYGYTPDGPLGAVLAGQEDTYIKGLRDWQNQQAAEKQAADIEDARMAKASYQAQVEAQRENMLANQSYRKVQEQDLGQKILDAKEAAAYAPTAIVSQLSQEFLDKSNGLSDADRMQRFAQAKSIFDRMQQSGSLPPSLQGVVGGPVTSTFNGETQTSNYDPEMMARFGQFANRNKTVAGLQQNLATNQARENIANIQGNFGLEKQRLANEGKLSMQKLKDAAGSGKMSASQFVASANMELMKLQNQLQDPNLSPQERENLTLQYQNWAHQLAYHYNATNSGKIMPTIDENTGGIKYTISKETPEITPTQISIDRAKELEKRYKIK